MTKTYLGSRKIQNALEEAAVKAKLSHDSQTQVGCVLLDDHGATLLSSYNGFIRQAPDSALPTTRPEKYPLMMHAEANLIYTAARLGIKMQGCSIVITHSPCQACVRALWQAGVSQIYFAIMHDSFVQHLADLRLQLSGTADYFALKLSPK